MCHSSREIGDNVLDLIERAKWKFWFGNVVEALGLLDALEDCSKIFGKF